MLFVSIYKLWIATVAHCQKKDNSYGNSKYTTITEKIIISYNRKEGEYEQEYSILRRAKNQAVRNNLKKFS